MSPDQVQNRLKAPQKSQKQKIAGQRAQVVWSLLVALAVGLVAVQQAADTRSSPNRSLAAASAPGTTAMTLAESPHHPLRVNSN